MRARATLAWLLAAVAVAAQEPRDTVLRREDVTTATLLRAAAETQAAWAAVRERPTAESHDRLQRALRRHGAELEAFLPEEEDAVRDAIARSLTLLAYAEADRTAGDLRRLATSLDLLDASIGVLLGPTAALEEEGVRASLMPPGWRRGPLGDADFRRTLRARPSRELVDAARRRIATLERQSRGSGRADAQLLAEITEIAFELLDRTPQLPPSAREGYRDALLRLEVTAENVQRAGREGGPSHVRRQVRLLGEALQEVRRYLEVGAPQPRPAR